MLWLATDITMTPAVQRANPPDHTNIPNPGGQETPNLMSQKSELCLDAVKTCNDCSFK